MEVKIIKPCRVNCLSGKVEVTQNEANRLFLLGLADMPKAEKKAEPKVEKKAEPKAEKPKTEE